MDQDDEDDEDDEEVDDVTVVELDYTKEDLHVDEVMRVLNQEKSSHEGVKICIWKGTKQSLIISTRMCTSLVISRFSSTTLSVTLSKAMLHMT